MKDQISFMSGLFDTAEAVPPVANDHHFGEDLAAWIAAKSKNSEFQFGSPVRTPTGWAEPVTAGGEKFMLGFGLVEGSAGKEYAEWLITINRPSSWRSGNSGSASRSRLCDHVHNLLREERGIREVQWD